MTTDDQQGKRAENQPDPAPAQITFLYESSDGKLCLFEDADGHLTAVPASKLA